MEHKVRRDEDHIYWVSRNGAAEERRPGFSEICSSMGVGKKDCADCVTNRHHSHGGAFYTDDDTAQGVALHGWLIFLAQGKTSEKPPEEQIAQRVEGIKKFLHLTGFRLEDGEKPLFCPSTQSCCTPDIWGWIGSKPLVIDAKRGGRMKKHKLQTAAQKITLKENGFIAEGRATLHLTNGDYYLEGHGDIHDEMRWRAIASGYHAKGFYI